MKVLGGSSRIVFLVVIILNGIYSRLISSPNSVNELITREIDGGSVESSVQLHKLAPGNSLID